MKWAGKGLAGEDKYPDGGTAGNGTAEYGWVAERLMQSEHLSEMMQAFWRSRRDQNKRDDCEPKGDAVVNFATWCSPGWAI